jgi:hypothetical protein
LANLNIVKDDTKKERSNSVLDYLGSNRQIKMQTLWLGRNLYLDFAFWQSKVFLNQITNNYLVWNTPNWLDFSANKVQAINLENTKFNIINYRIHAGNYINSEVGKLNVLNGELRTLVSLLSEYRIPYYELQYKIFRFFNKLKLLSIYWPIAVHRRTPKASAGKIIEFAIKKRASDFSSQVYLNALVQFYQSDTKRTIEMQIPAGLPIYTGADMRTFNQKMIDNQLEPFYVDLLKEMRTGFTEIVTTTKNHADWQIIVKFLNIGPYVKLEMRG